MLGSLSSKSPVMMKTTREATRSLMRVAMTPAQLWPQLHLCLSKMQREHVVFVPA